MGGICGVSSKQHESEIQNTITQKKSKSLNDNKFQDMEEFNGISLLKPLFIFETIKISFSYFGYKFWK